MKKTTRKKLTLNRETVKTLQDDVLGAIAGGCEDISIITMCDRICAGDCTGGPNVE